MSGKTWYDQSHNLGGGAVDVRFTVENLQRTRIGPDAGTINNARVAARDMSACKAFATVPSSPAKIPIV